MELVTPGIGLMFWTVVIFTLLLILLKKFAWGPILESVDNRNKNIEDALAAAENAKKKMEELTSNNEKILADARLERETILKEARAIREKTIADAKNQASNEAEKIITKARLDAQEIRSEAKTSAEKILDLRPQGIFLSNGPGDPAATGKYAIEILNKLIKKNLPIFGICLGHQILALALGGKTKKMKLGHRGANHPVKNLIHDNVEITSQNHGFEVVKQTLPKNIEVTHKSLFDNSIEGIKLKNKPVFSVQYHPESNPGPQDSVYLFQEFINNMKKNAKKKRY